MFGNNSLDEIIALEWSAIIDEYGLVLRSLNADDAILISTSYVLRFQRDRDGVSLVYYDKSSDPFNGYNIDLYMINRRRKELSEILPFRSTEDLDFTTKVIRILAAYMRHAGTDILAGEKDWLRGYIWPTFKPDMASDLLQV